MAIVFFGKTPQGWPPDRLESLGQIPKQLHPVVLVCARLTQVVPDPAAVHAIGDPSPWFVIKPFYPNADLLFPAPYEYTPGLHMNPVQGPEQADRPVPTCGLRYQLNEQVLKYTRVVSQDLAGV